LRRPNWHNLRRLTPVSDVFGLDRGKPIDRYYIERFLENNHVHIHGRVLEVGENTYTRKFGLSVESSDILQYKSSHGHSPIRGDLTVHAGLPKEQYDCFICTQTLNFIYDVQRAVEGIHYLLRPNGVALVTVAGISQISKYDMERWGDYWRFSKQSAAKVFGVVFGEENIKVSSHGNVLSCISFLEGLAVEELTTNELDYTDEGYQMTVTVVARKKG
jgi:hypothetical protein